MLKLFLPYDVYERHRKIGEEIKNFETVVDIGGELNHLNKFCHPKKLVVANLNTGDVIISKDKLPFKKNSFDIVCAIDVLEHIPKDERKKFIENIINIASKKVILSFPVYTDLHEKYEKEVLKWLKSKGRDVSYLKEHVKLGLPKREEIHLFTKRYKTRLSYSGNLSLNGILFRLYMFDPKIMLIRKVVYLLKLLLNLSSNKILYSILAGKPYSTSVNRAYVTIYKS